MTSDGSESDRSSGPSGTMGRMGRMRERWRNTTARYLVVVLLYLGLWGVLWKNFHGLLSPAINEMSLFTASAVYETLALFWTDVGLENRAVSLGGFTVFVIGECVGLLEFVIYSVFVLAYPTEWRAKLLGLVIGPLVIFVFNVSRISLLLVVGRDYPSFFDFFHIYFWQTTLIAIIAATWLLWLRVFAFRWYEPS